MVDLGHDVTMLLASHCKTDYEAVCISTIEAICHLAVKRGTTLPMLYQQL